MKKTILLPAIILLVAAVILLLQQAYKGQYSKNKPSIHVCQAPDICKDVPGAELADLKNPIGVPAEHHRLASVAQKDTSADFLAGYFDEKAFYFRHGKRVFYFINAKIISGFYEDAGPLPGSDADSFELIDANFSKDKKQVYGRPDMNTRIAIEPIAGADPASFMPLDFPYAVDKDNVYYLNHRIEADRASFRITENKECGQDDGGYYKDGEKVGEDECE